MYVFSEVKIALENFENLIDTRKVEVDTQSRWCIKIEFSSGSWHSPV